MQAQWDGDARLADRLRRRHERGVGQGPALDDIESLLKMPYGCGEQNVLNFAPNIFIMQYLKSVDAVTSDLVQLTFCKSGIRLLSDV